MQTKRLKEDMIKRLEPLDKRYTKFDGDGLFISVEPTGGKLWRYQYRFNEKSKLLSLGKYPDVSLQLARKRHAEAREFLLQGIDPSEIRKTEKQKAQDEQARQIAETRFTLDSKGALSIRFGRRILSLNSVETAELYAFARIYSKAGGRRQEVGTAESVVNGLPPKGGAKHKGPR